MILDYMYRGMLILPSVICLCLINPIVYSQVSWNKSIDYSQESNYGISLLQSSFNDNYIVGILTYPENIYQGALIELDQHGKVEWSKSIQDSIRGFYFGTNHEISSTKIWTLGLIPQDSGSIFAPAIISTNYSGEELWRKTYNFSPYNVNFNSIFNMYDDSTVLVFFDGYYANPEGQYFHKHGYILLDTLGVEKKRHWFSSSFNIVRPNDIKRFPEGGFMTSFVEISQGQGIPFEHAITIKRLDDTFGVIWQKTLPIEEAPGGKFSFDSNHNIYMTWNEDPLNPGTGSPWGSPVIISYDKNGKFRWKKVFDDNPRSRSLGNIITTSQGNIIASGYDEPGFPPLRWGWMVSLDTNGYILWDRKYTLENISPNFGGFFGTHIEARDNSLVVVGSIHDKYPLESFVSRNNVWALKMNLNGCIENEECIDFTTLTSINDFDFQTKEVICYPNPTTGPISLQLPNDEELTIVIMSISGKLIDINKNFGGNINIDLSYLDNGMYVVKLFGKNNFKTIQLVVTK